MLVLVVGQTLSALECLWADRTHQRLFQRRASVSLQCRHPRKLALTQRTHEAARFVDEMSTHVSLKRELVGKVGAAVVTAVRLLPSVSFGVCVKASQCGESLPAVGAEVGFGVAQVVSLQKTLPTEGFGTRRTLHGL